ILQLVQEGKISLDTKLSDLLPVFPKEKFGNITIDHLLRHTSGFPDYNNYPEFFNDVHDYRLTDAEIIERISRYDLLFQPGTKFSYSNDGYVLLGAILKNITGKSYDQLLKERITARIGMVNTGYASRTLVVNKMARGYRRSLRGIENA